MKTLLALSLSVLLLTAVPANSTSDICDFGFFSDWYKSDEPVVRKAPPKREVRKPVVKEAPKSRWQDFKDKTLPKAKVVKVKEEPKQPWYSKWLSPQSRGANYDGYKEYTDERTKTVPVE